jgi:hypothetical protein
MSITMPGLTWSGKAAPRTVIDNVIGLCSFPNASTMVEYIRSEGRIEVANVVIISL